MKQFIRILSASIALFTSAAFAAPADNTASQYKPTNGAAGSVGAAVIQQSVDGYNSIPINSTHPLPVSCSGCGGTGGDASAANQVVEQSLLGGLLETAPATDTASSGLNGRSQRIAQRLTSLIALMPSSLGAKTTALSLAVTLPSDGTLPLPTGAATAAKQPALGTAGTASSDVLSVQGIASMTPLTMQGTVSSGASDTGNPNKIGGVYNTTLPIATTGQRVDAQTDASGNLRSRLVASVTAATDATSNSVGFVTDSATAATAGRLLGVADYNYNGSTWDRSPGNTAGAYAQGNVASAATDSGNPLKIGGKYNSTMPTFTDGQRADVQSDAAGNIRVRLSGTLTTPADAQSNSNGEAALNGMSDVAATRRLGVLNYEFNGTTWDRQRGDVNGIVTQPYAFAANNWSYAAASGGITNTTTAVTIKAAAGGALRNCITHVDIDAGTLGAATEVAIRDGAAGTVLWRGIETTAGGLKSFNLTSPICGTANTLLEFVTLTATVTGGVYVNASGFTR